MPKRPDFTLRISIRNIEDFSPEAIVRSPRTFRPVDVQNACKNLAVDIPKGTPSVASALATYIIFDFFAFAHSSGLFNRQIKLWEALTKTQSIEISQKDKGMFSKEKLPEFDISFLDHKKRCIVFAHFAAPVGTGLNFDYAKSCTEFLRRASAMQGLSGVFLCYPNPFPQKVVDYVKKETNAADAIARYESIMPKLGVPINLLELEGTPIFNPSEQIQTHKIRLVHPDLNKKKPGGPKIPGANLHMLDEEGSL
jgi:hypothetical protein